MKILLAVLFTFNAYSFETHFNKDEVKLVVGVNSSNTFEIQMEAPSKLLLGINHKPQNNDELMRWKSIQTLWFKNYRQLFTIKGLNCSTVESEIELDVDTDLGVGAILGRLVYYCKTSVIGKNLSISLKESFKEINQIELTSLPLKLKASKVYLKNSIDSLVLR
jgi:hypothetical protein